jgi:hypothetical protein
MGPVGPLQAPFMRSPQEAGDGSADPPEMQFGEAAGSADAPDDDHTDDLLMAWLSGSGGIHPNASNAADGPGWGADGGDGADSWEDELFEASGGGAVIEEGDDIDNASWSSELSVVADLLGDVISDGGDCEQDAAEHSDGPVVGSPFIGPLFQCPTPPASPCGIPESLGDAADADHSGFQPPLPPPLEQPPCASFDEQPAPPSDAAASSSGFQHGKIHFLCQSTFQGARAKRDHLHFAVAGTIDDFWVAKRPVCASGGSTTPLRGIGASI